MLSEFMGYIASLPFILIFSIIYLFVTLGTTFFAGIAVFIAAFAFKPALGKLDGIV